ncbi:TPA: fimbria/pilus outer membrane usher protein [Escherichia coli]|nr:fimbria/pilus outer membrane usher protein [Escherichia coli]EKY5157508.1 fimbria/pilus outer membrane usher protein [Escherichia coli]HDC1081330.1 fimbria/pilus outer membrane usher protein [Escherichia coli]HDC1342692.1 fimbria/pilus outer membrane usher protein [Escherichia coli]HDC1882119.1 fimbria/pilus outer membrane usher protein [Escherichia coli]
MEDKFSFTINSITCMLLIFMASSPVYAVVFNTDALDAVDRQNIDFSRFSQAGYILPGQYQMDIMVNEQSISPSPFLVRFLELPVAEKDRINEKSLPQPCLTPEMVNKMGLTTASQERVLYLDDSGQCADFRLLPGVEIRSNTAEGMLYINMPQAWLEYSDNSWLPPSQWDNGIPGGMFDYNINGTAIKTGKGKQTQSVGYNGTAGVNFGAWRFRADYQGNLNHTTGSGPGTDSLFTWSRFYMYRAIPRWHSNLTLGENYINSEIFNSWRYVGISLENDDRMLPPKLRGYAPQVSGIANTNARVVISQQGLVLYDSTVPVGPFTIQDLDSSVRGHLDVEVIEQNGQKKAFRVNTAYVPYLTRPGQIRYKLSTGRSRSYEHATEGQLFIVGEASWGFNNKLSLYSGGIVAGDYNTLAVGIGRDLSPFGTLSADVTQSVAQIPREETKQGKSWSLRYSKRFDDVDADIQFAGYRVSERNYITMQQYLDARYRHDFTSREKELYDISLNKSLEDSKTSVSLQYSHQTYWDKRRSNYYTLSLNRYFNAFGLNNISVGASASRSWSYQKGSNSGGTYNDSVYLSLSVPWGTGVTSYSGSMSNDRYTNMVGYSDTVNDGMDSYSLNVGVNTGNGQPSQSQISAYYNHSSPLTNLSANFSAAENGYMSFGMSASGGATITAKGAALQAGGMNGGTRLLVDTDGVGGVPVDGGRVYTNRWGIGVVTDVSSYYRHTTSVELNKLPDDMEATRSVVESVLTEGAIGYRVFEVLKGSRLFAVIRLADNSHPPFGASVTNAKGRELGMVADSGLAWLSGVNPGETLNVGWDGLTQCVVDIPKNLEPAQQLLLSCFKVN